MHLRDVMKQELKDLIQETVDTLGFVLVESHYESYRGKFELKVVIYHPEKIGSDDCSKVASTLSRRLDIEDIIPEAYNLIVESPGVEYVFKDPAHYGIFLNKEIQVTVRDFGKYGLKDPVLLGTNLGLSEAELSIQLKNETKKISLSDISKCRLYFDIKKYL